VSRKTHCPQGHVLDNSSVWNGRRRCITCQRARADRRRQRRQAATGRPPQSSSPEQRLQDIFAMQRRRVLATLYPATRRDAILGEADVLTVKTGCATRRIELDDEETV